MGLFSSGENKGETLKPWTTQYKCECGHKKFVNIDTLKEIDTIQYGQSAQNAESV